MTAAIVAAAIRSGPNCRWPVRWASCTRRNSSGPASTTPTRGQHGGEGDRLPEHDGGAGRPVRPAGARQSIGHQTGEQQGESAQPDRGHGAVDGAAQGGLDRLGFRGPTRPTKYGSAASRVRSPTSPSASSISAAVISSRAAPPRTGRRGRCVPAERRPSWRAGPARSSRSCRPASRFTASRSCTWRTVSGGRRRPQLRITSFSSSPSPITPAYVSPRTTQRVSYYDG